MSSFLDRLRRWRTTPTSVATIDTAQAAPPPSPLAPVDLTDEAQVAGVMDIAARIGDILLSSGTSNSDTKLQIHAVTSAYGLVWCHVDITMNTIIISSNIGHERKTPVSVFRVVRQMTTNFSRLSEVDRLIRSIQAGATPPEIAERILNELEVKPSPYGAKVAVLGWGIMGGPVSVMLGGNLTVSIIAFITSMAIMGVNEILARHRLPLFYQNVIGGMIATVPAALTFAAAARFGVDLRPSQIVAAGIIVLLAGLTLVQSLQDGITGAPVTASARFFETLLFTGAIIAGVGLGLQTAGLIGITLPPFETVAPANENPIWLRVVTGGIATAGFAIACYAEWSAVFISALTAAAGSVFYYLVVDFFGAGAVLASSAAAVVIGLAGGLMARRFKIPPLITAIAGITPMLPGLSVYRGMYAMLAQQPLIGFTNIATALAIACALAAGVVLGEWVARRIRRPQRFNPYRGFRSAGRYTFTQAQRRAAQTRQRRRQRHDERR